MDFNKLYKKLPEKIQNSETLIYCSIKFLKMLEKFKGKKESEASQ